MRVLLAALALVASTSLAVPQNQSENPTAPNDAMGRPLKQDSKGQPDTTAPTTTPAGGPPAASPQGETPPGNMAAPDGSSKPVKPKE